VDLRVEAIELAWLEEDGDAEKLVYRVDARAVVPAASADAVPIPVPRIEDVGAAVA
jgi:hypothetical protein